MDAEWIKERSQSAANLLVNAPQYPIEPGAVERTTLIELMIGVYEIGFQLALANEAKGLKTNTK